MNYLSLIYGLVSFIIIIVCIVIIIVKQWSLKSSAVYYFLGLMILLGLWILSDLLQVITSKPGDTTLPYIFAICSTITNALAMICSILFANSLSGQLPIKRFAVYLVFFLMGGVIALTFSPTVFSVSYNSDLDYVKSSANIIWIICLTLGVITSGTFFLIHLIRQHKIINKKHKISINFLIAGVVIAFYGSIVFYALRYILVLQSSFLHAELISTSIGVSLMAIGMILGGKTALYGSSQVISINIYNEHGLNLYQGFFTKIHSINEHLVSGLATAISAFASEIIGEDVFPREVDLGNYSLILYKQKSFVGFICCKYPTFHIHYGLKKVMNSFDPDMTYNEVAKIINNFLPYGEPVRLNADDDLTQINRLPKI
ncbi:MAG: hypothetical protein JXA54_15480 [Candidatus Heimdallarchaeota archaeon]|nr:hypothetical protein [Candidatus Heimdallarchaeota archaeon]